MTKKIIPLALALLLPLSLSGCLGLAAGAGASAGVAAAQEGGIKGATTDAAIRISIADAWIQKSTDMYAKLSATVKEGRVLVTGSVPTADMRVDAIRLVWQIKGVKQVINEVKVDQGTGAAGYVTDSWITSNIKTHLLLDKYIQSINYTIETVDATVYVMGVAQDQKELDRVVNYARNTRYVKNVVSYVRLRGEPLPEAPAPMGSAPQPASSVTTNMPMDNNPPPQPGAVTSEPLR